MTVAIIIIASVLSVDLGQELNKKRRPFLSFNNIILSSPPKIDFFENKILFAIAILDKDFQPYDYENYFDFEINLINKTLIQVQNNDVNINEGILNGPTIKEKNIVSAKTYKIDFIECLDRLNQSNELQFLANQDPNLLYQIEKNKIFNASCFNDYFNINEKELKRLYIEGDINSNIFSYLQITIKKCSRKKRIDCLADDYLTQEKIQNSQLAVHLIDKAINPYSFDAPLNYYMRSNFFNLDDLFTKNIDIYFKNSTLNTDKGLMFQDWNSHTNFSLNYINEKISSQKNNNLAVINIQSSLDSDYYRRYYMKLQDLAAVIGGIVNAGMVIGELISRFINKHLMYSIILNNLFDFRIRNEDMDLIKNNVKFNSETDSNFEKNTNSSFISQNSRRNRRSGISLGAMNPSLGLAGEANNWKEKFKDNNDNTNGINKQNDICFKPISNDYFEKDNLYSSNRYLMNTNRFPNKNNEEIYTSNNEKNDIVNEINFSSKYKPNEYQFKDASMQTKIFSDIKNYNLKNLYLNNSFDMELNKNFNLNKERIKNNLLNLSSESNYYSENKIDNNSDYIRSEGKIFDGGYKKKKNLLNYESKKVKENDESLISSDIDENVDYKKFSINETKNKNIAIVNPNSELDLINTNNNLLIKSKINNNIINSHKYIDLIKDNSKDWNTIINKSESNLLDSLKRSHIKENINKNISEIFNEHNDPKISLFNELSPEKNINFNKNIININQLNLIENKGDNKNFNVNNEEENINKILHNSNKSLNYNNWDNQGTSMINRYKSANFRSNRNLKDSNVISNQNDNLFLSNRSNEDYYNPSKPIIRSKTRSSIANRKKRTNNFRSSIYNNSSNMRIMSFRKSKENIIKFYNNLISKNKNDNSNSLNDSENSDKITNSIKSSQTENKNNFNLKNNLILDTTNNNNRKIIKAKKSKLDQKLVLLEGVSYEELEKTRLKNSGILDIGTWQLLSLTFCFCKKKIKQKNEFLDQCQVLMGKYLDYIKIIELLKEFNRLKKILFSNNQLRLFSYLPNPILTYKNEELNVDNLYQDIFFGAKAQTKKLSKLLKSYVNVLGKQTDCVNEKKINDRIIDFMDDELKNCFETVVANYLNHVQASVNNNVNKKKHDDVRKSVLSNN